MSEMTERVIEAISAAEKTWWASNTEGGPGLQQTVARAAIEAMREPTGSMLRAATSAEHDHYWPGKEPTSHTWTSLPVMLVKKLWSGMIDAALK